MEMRTVYIDVLVVVNCFIDLLLLLCVSRLLHLRTKPLRLLFASLVGGSFSLTALLPPIPRSSTAPSPTCASSPASSR